MDVKKKLGAEFLGTFWLVFGGCGAAVLAAVHLGPGGTNLGIGFVGVALAFGLTVLTGVYAFGTVSGGHFNPAVTLGLVAAKRFPAKDAAPYIVTQVLAAITAAAVLWVIAISQKGQTAKALAESGFASNGFGAHSPGNFALIGCLVCEVVLTAIFLFVIIGATDKRGHAPLAGVAIGLCLTLIHLVSIPVTNTSVNPARSTGPALAALVGGESWPATQLWLFWLAPIVGAVIAGLTYRHLLPEHHERVANA